MRTRFKNCLITTAAGLLTCLAGCGGGVDAEEVTREVSVQFAALANGEDVQCGESYTLGSADTEVTFSYMRFYVHDVHLIRDNGEEVPMMLTTDSDFQHDDVALLDFEDDTGACSNASAATNTTVTGIVTDVDDYTGVRFTLGVPFDLNHADVGALPSPLNVPSMFWSWQGGRKFIRIDGEVDGKGMRFHLGSTGCMGQGNDVEACTNPNRVEIRLDDVDVSAGQRVALDLDRLFEEVDLTPDDDSSAVCMSGPNTPACGPMFSSVGLSYDGGPAGAAEAFMVEDAN